MGFIKILGIDEAGRGAVLGPLVICGLFVDEKRENRLKKLGVKDSKQLTPKKRLYLAPRIEKIADSVVVMKVQPCKIDSNRKMGVNLNKIEALKMAEIINLIEPDKAIIDTPSYNTTKFSDFLFSKLEKKDVELVCENYADETYPIVSAASIIAKVSRDEDIEELKKKVGYDFGVGYPHDARTIEFIKKLVIENKGKLPNYIRHTWATVETIVAEHKQTRVLSFLEKLIKK